MIRDCPRNECENTFRQHLRISKIKIELVPLTEPELLVPLTEPWIVVLHESHVRWRIVSRHRTHQTALLYATIVMGSDSVFAEATR